MNKLGIFINFWENTWNVDHIKYMKKAKDIGFDILEFQAQSLLDMSYDHMDEMRQVAEELGIELTYSLGLDPKYDVSSGDEAVRLGGVEYLKRVVGRIGYMGGQVLSGVSYAGWGCRDVDPVLGKAPLLENSLKSMGEIIKTAEDYGVTYCVEAVNRFEGCLINTAEEAVAYVDAVGSPNIGVLLDTYHMNIEENSFTEAIHLAGNKLVSVHMGDNNRRCPGRGHINFDEIFKALADINFKGRIVSEPFVAKGNEVGRDICVWRDLEQDMSPEYRDKEAAYLLDYKQNMLRKYGMA
ncbi:MAG TPA: sugar phosphate isomerase/epimerase [Clostridiales bacterium]|nr:sugar phosphate isomerase/epimerase [Clostridiales bacterium]